MVTAISLRWRDKELPTFLEMLCAGAIVNVECFSLPTKVFCATIHVGVVLYMLGGIRKGVLGRRFGCRSQLTGWGGGKDSQPPDFSHQL